MSPAPTDGAPTAATGGPAPAPSGAVAPGVRADHGSVAAGSVCHSLIQVFNQTAPLPTGDAAQALEAAYLHRLCNECGRLDWLASVGLEDGQTAEVRLGAVYTALRTNRGADAGRRTPAGSHPDAGEHRLSALAVLDAERHLVLTGDPGSGKSAFADFVALCLAGERLATGRPGGDPAAPDPASSGPRLADLIEPLPGERGGDTPQTLAPRRAAAGARRPAGLRRC